MTKKEDKNIISVPVVCTRGIIVFPNQEVIIDVGRPKSIEAIEEAESFYDRHVFLVAQTDVMTEDPTGQDLYATGTLCEIRSVRKMDGFFRVKFHGLERAQWKQLHEEGRFIVGDIQPVVDEVQDEMEELALVRRIAKTFENMDGSNINVPKEMIAEMAKGVSAIQLADQVAQILPIPVEKRQMMLETLGINDRLLLIIQEIENEKQLAKIENDLNDKIKSRIEDSQKEYYLREKMRAIKEELGDTVDKDDDVAKIREMLAKNPYPKAIKDKISEELSRYEMLPPASSESGVIKTYIDWLIRLPWWQESQDNEDLNLASEILDADHFGLEKVKERILEYLAVKQMTNSLKAPIICLVGPPGVGKTSLSKSVARALSREFVKMSVGGVKDESEIRGHRRTYLGSMPGRIIQGMKKAGTINPVFLIDEIDKMASDYKGDPTSAMLEVLDPEQNSFFSDHYLEENYDLSKVLFIATANYIENIPPALQDRLEIINLSSYTELEKLSIARRHLITKQLQANGLKPSNMKIEDDMLSYIIKYYTRESGVRQLERLIATLARKTVLSVVKDKKRSVKITKKQIQAWLGPEKFEYGKKEAKNQVGTVTGLAYTAFGGDILQIEATMFPGKGGLIITGQLGDVMKESTTIAYGYVKANAKKFGIPYEAIEKHDIHIHVPEGAVPKDGPSAGITLTTAIVSLLSNRPVVADLAMTGEVTLRGNVLPIGGLREKSLAAYRSGITTILIPKGNEKDIAELPQAIKDHVKIIPVDHVSKVIDFALVK
ncbi:MAG: endopeptidase La [Erysipelotrichaceae bacterium]